MLGRGGGRDDGELSVSMGGNTGREVFVGRAEGGFAQIVPASLSDSSEWPADEALLDIKCPS